MNIFGNLDNIKLTPTDKYIIKKIAQNYDKFLDLPIDQFAQFAHCSVAAISRLSKRLKFKNYGMFKIYISSTKIKTHPNSNSQKIEFSNQKMHDLASIYIKTIEKNASLNNKKIVKLASEIISSKRIILYGSGSSFMPLRHLTFNLEKIGFNCYCEVNFHKTLNILKQAPPVDTIIILFSKSFASKEARFLLDTARKLKMNCYIFTTDEDVIKTKHENIIVFKHFPQKDRHFSISSKIAAFYYIDLLLLYIIEKKALPPENNELITMWNEYK